MKTERMTGAEFEALLVRRAELEKEYDLYCLEPSDPYCVRKAGIVWRDLESVNPAIEAELEAESANEYMVEMVRRAAEDELSPRR